MILPSKWYQVGSRSGIEEKSTDQEQFLIGVFASLGSLLFGYDLGVIGQVIAPTGNVMLTWNPNSSEM